MSSNIDLYTLKWSTMNFYDLVQIYRDVEVELEHVSDEYARSMEPERKAYFQGAQTALRASQEKILHKLSELLEEFGYLDPLEYPEPKDRVRRARPIMDLMAQDLFN